MPYNYKIILKLHRVRFSILIQSIHLNAATLTFHPVVYAFMETVRIKIYGIRREITRDKKRIASTIFVTNIYSKLIASTIFVSTRNIL